MRRKKIFVKPHLNDRGGDIQKKWYVELSQRNPQTGEMVRRRYQSWDSWDINQGQTPVERKAVAAKIIEFISEKVESGWSIFADTDECVYDDQLQYSNAARVFKAKVKDNHTYIYYASEYIRQQENDLKPETRFTYCSRYRVFGLWLQSKGLQDVDITGITNGVIIDFFTYLKEDRQLSSRTYRSYADLLRAFFDSLANREIIPKNPVYNLPRNRCIKDMGAERIQKQHLELLMPVMDERDPQLAMFCRFEYYCGMRPGYEIRLLRVRDIDFQPGRSRVRVISDNAKTSRRREVAIPDVFLAYLVEKGIDKYAPDDYVFSKDGKPGPVCLGKNTMRYRFNRFRKELGLPTDNKLYSMKHTGAVTLAESGEKLINIRDHLGHTSIATTEHYLKRLGFNDSEIIRHRFPAI